MSVNLTLALDRGPSKDLPVLCYDRLSLAWQDYDVFDSIRSHAQLLEHGVQWYCDEGLETQSSDPYGEPLTFISAGRLATILDCLPLQGLDAAVRALVRAAPPGARIVLWWH